VDDKLWSTFQPTVAMQNDVNGFPRSAAIKLLDKGIKYFWTGINDLNNGAPFKQPFPFWWKMPDGRRMLVMCGLPYWEGYGFFAEKDWRSTQREANNLQFWSPREGDMLQSDEASVRKAHEICLKKIKKMKKEGYKFDFITTSITNQWRIDNDGPFSGLCAFVAKWNELGLQPRLNLVTIGEAMQKVESRVGKILPEYEGEWTDWWAFGAMANPPELSAVKQSVNYLDAALSPVWGQLTEGELAEANEINHLLCRYYEHTWANNESYDNPYGAFNVGHLAEKAKFAYYPYEKAKWLLAQRVRKHLSNEPEGLYVVNTHKNPYSGWVELDINGFRSVKYKYVENTETKEQTDLKFSNIAKFWVSSLQPQKIYRFMLKTGEFNKTVKPTSKPDIKTDKNNWPVSVTWEGMKEPLFTEGLANIKQLQISNYKNDRYALFHDIPFMEDSLRKVTLAKITRVIESSADSKADMEENEFSVKYTQKIKHPRMNWITRQVEIFKGEPKISVVVKFDRISSKEAEIIYVDFPLPKGLKSPKASCGGVPFDLYTDQLPNTCKDYFAVDGWVAYNTETNGSWIWTSRDVPLVTFDTPSLCARLKNAPENVNNLMAMVYNNNWWLNFLTNCPGEMTFNFDLQWQKNTPSPTEIRDIAKTNFLPPVVFRNPPTRENPIELKNMTQVISGRN